MENIRSLARSFLNTEAAGGIVLFATTVIALVWVNSPFQESYGSLWGTELRLPLGSLELAQDLRHWVNDGLMTVFFFVVALEIKRELVAGELNELRKAALPVFAALGGMIVPAAIYLAFNLGGPGERGWGIPMATDIAFAVGVLALLSKRVPSGLKVFVLSLAIADDIGAILVIALFYSSGLHLGWLAGAASVLMFIVALRRLRVSWAPIYVLLGAALWLATFESGIHATIAGVALGLATPARSAPGLERALHPWTSFVVVPLFALANAGLVISLDSIRNAATSRVTVGIVVGLVVGKIVGIAGMSWLAIKLNLAVAPEGVPRRHLFGAAAVAGIGFTVSLFITGLAFTDADLADAAKLGVLVGSIIAGIGGAAILATGNPPHGHAARRSPQDSRAS